MWQIKGNECIGRAGAGREDLARALPRLILAAVECADPVSGTRHEVLPVELPTTLARSLPRIEDLGAVAVDPGAIPMAEAEFARMLRPGGHLVYAVPTARHLFGLKEILYDCPYENEVRQTEYDGFAFVKAVESTAVITLEGQSVQDLFAMTPYYWNTPADGAARLAECERLTTEIGFRFLVYQKV